jgi:hypothetical protein
VVCGGGGILFLLPLPFSFSPALVVYFLLSSFCYPFSSLWCHSILRRQPCCCPGLLTSFHFWPFAARRSPSSTRQPGSTLVFRWVLINLQSTYLKLTRAYTHHSIVTTGLSALHRPLAIRRLHCTRRSLSSTRLSMDLTCQRVILTPRAVASFCHLLPWTVHPFGRSSTFITTTTGGLVFCCVSACIFYFSVFSCFFLLYFVVFNFLLLCLGFSLHMVLGFIFVVETSVSGDSTPFSLVPDSNLISAFPLLTSFGWLMLFLVGSADGFGPYGVLTPVIRVCKLLRFMTLPAFLLPFKSLYAVPWKGPGYLFGPFPTLLPPLFFSVFGSIVGEPIPFWFFNHL